MRLATITASRKSLVRCAGNIAGVDDVSAGAEVLGTRVLGVVKTRERKKTGIRDSLECKWYHTEACDNEDEDARSRNS
jgi:hypothetical protein